MTHLAVQTYPVLLRKNGSTWNLKFPLFLPDFFLHIVFVLMKRYINLGVVNYGKFRIFYTQILIHTIPCSYGNCV